MNNPQNPIVSRPAPSAWAGVGLAAFFGISFSLIALLDAPKFGQSWFFWFVVVVSVICGVALLIYIARHRVIADENGLRWRGTFSNWKSVRWDEVSDFFLSNQRKNERTYVVETARGALTFDSNSDAHAEELAALIALRVTRAPFRKWNAKGLRFGEEFERVFHPLDISWRTVAVTFAPILLLSLTALPFLRPRDFAQWQAARLASSDWQTWPLWAPFVLLAIFISALTTAMIAPIISARRQRERVIVTHRGLRFEKAGRIFEFGWDELRAVRLRNERAHFVSARGDWRMQWLAGLRPLIELHAPNATIDSEEDNLDVAPPLQLENGTTFYSFRTTALRLLLRITLPIALAIAITVWIMPLTQVPDEPRDNSIWLMVPFYAALALWLWRLYRRGGISLTEAKIEIRGAWRTRTFRWSKIDECGGENGEFWIRVGERRLKLWNWNKPVRCDELRAQIEQRIAQSRL